MALAGFCLGLAVCAGCGDGLPKRAPVSGQVLIDGEPLHLGYIRLIPKNARPAGGDIGPDGRFTLTTFGDNDGAVLGTHEVTVRAVEELNSTQVKWHAPKKYAKAGASGLTAVISGPTDSLVIKLSWEGGQPFVDRIDPE